MNLNPPRDALQIAEECLTSKCIVALPHVEITPLIKRIESAIITERKRIQELEAQTAGLRETLQEIVDTWGRDDEFSCDDGTLDCEISDPRDDNEGVRCDFHDMMKRTRQALSSTTAWATAEKAPKAYRKAREEAK